MIDPPGRSLERKIYHYTNVLLLLVKYDYGEFINRAMACAVDDSNCMLLTFIYCYANFLFCLKNRLYEFLTSYFFV